MFLTKIDLDPNRRLARKYLGSPQVMHAVVMKAAAANEPPASERGRVLWRMDRGAFGLGLFILSPGRPEIGQLVHEAGLADGDARTLDYEPFLARLANDQAWAFRLVANPTRSESRGEGVRGKRFGHVTAEQQRQWLIDRSQKHGFIVADPPVSNRTAVSDEQNPAGYASVSVVRRERPVFSRQSPEGGRNRVTINTTVFEGILRITDVDVFRQVLTHGLGPSKAYGCGLMTLAPVHRT